MKKSNSFKKNGAKNFDKSNNMPIKEAVAYIEPENDAAPSETISLKEIETTVMIKLRETHKAVVLLASRRLESKLSNTRVVGVARELNELIKVMAVYETV